ncbi:MAG: DNA/RNA non-specific endonuclease [Methanoregula sp.]|nr:DNA/RNA non-specific endonuclease [Methanoregula sp.]
MSLIQWNREAIERQQAEALRRYNESAAIRNRNQSELENKTVLEVDAPTRVLARKGLIDPRDGLTLERLIGTSDLFPISYLESGLKAGRSVCRIEIRDSIGRVLGYGTGFLVSPSLLLTNNHVLDDEETAHYSLAQFNCETDLNLLPRPVKSFRIDPDRLFITDRDLDFTLVAVEKSSAEGILLSEFGYLPFIPAAGKILVGEYVSCIQHPEGAPKAVAIRENELIALLDNFVHYMTDTQPGSSGSPVFSDDWKVVALHHAGVPDKDDPKKYVANEGVRISSIARRITEIAKDRSAEERLVINELYAGVVGTPPGTGVAPAMEVSTRSREFYDKSSGYDPHFLGAGFEVPYPVIGRDMAADVLLLKDGGSVLDYTHFSLVMSRLRKLPFFTAVNIDGSQLQDLKRSKDVWYFDPRIEKSDQYGPELYESNELDRGHLVRRLDPVWGDEAVEGNEDTFHFTNCSPQHKNLNQKTWLNLEDYVGKNAKKYGLKVNVFTGPVFRSDDRVYRGQYRIPAEFWKLVVMVKDDGKLSATAYLQTQKNLIDNLEFAYSTYKTYQVPVATIEELTGLDFGNLRSCDPLANIESIAGRVIERVEDLRL